MNGVKAIFCFWIAITQLNIKDTPMTCGYGDLHLNVVTSPVDSSNTSIVNTSGCMGLGLVVDVTTYAFG
jgi:hypothetical protein